jgi:hypothetical protein
MRAVVVYESMFGATHEVAAAVAVGLRERFDEVDVLPVAAADIAHVTTAALLVVGGPTHVHGMSRPQTRRSAVDEPSKYSTGELEPGASGIGVREWLDGLAGLSGQAAAFDTRMDGPAVLTGRASRGIARRLHQAGLSTVLPPESFIVEKGGRLREGEVSRAQAWGSRVAAIGAHLSSRAS